MTAPPPRRPWWRRKRAWAAAALWLLAAYPASYGPACYCLNRGWLDRSAFDAVFDPVEAAVRRSPWYWPYRYAVWWSRLGYRHAASD